MHGHIKAWTSASPAPQSPGRSSKTGARSSPSLSSVACITTISGEQPPDPHSLALPEGLKADSFLPQLLSNTIASNEIAFPRALGRSAVYSPAEVDLPSGEKACQIASDRPFCCVYAGTAVFKWTKPIPGSLSEGSPKRAMLTRRLIFERMGVFGQDSRVPVRWLVLRSGLPMMKSDSPWKYDHETNRSFRGSGAAVLPVVARALYR